MYNVRIALSNHTAHVERPICVCPVGLSGCCNHITATLYCVEDYFRMKGIRKAALKSYKPGTSREKKLMLGQQGLWCTEEAKSVQH